MLLKWSLRRTNSLSKRIRGPTAWDRGDAVSPHLSSLNLSLLEGAAFSLSLLILSVSSPFFPWLSVVTVVEYRSGKDRLFHCLKNNLSLHLHPRMGGITMNSCVNLQGVCLCCSESRFKYQLYILWCVSVFRWTYVPGQCFFKQLWSRGMPSSNREEQKCLSWSWDLRVHLPGGSSHSSSGPQARLQNLLHDLRVQFWEDSSGCLGEQDWQALLTGAGS